MKKLYILILLLITFGSRHAYTQTVTLGAVPATLCANEKLYIPVTLSSGFNSGNVIQIELSNSSGVFVSTYIGALITNTQGEQFVEINIDPAATLSTLYLLRATTSSPSTVSVTSAAVNINCTTLDYFWVGGSGNWSDFGNHWATNSGGSTFHTEAPNLNDDVYFDSNSFPSGGSVNIDQEAFCNDMTWTDGSSSPSLGGGYRLNVRGKYVLAPGVQRNHYETRFNSDKMNLAIDLAGSSYESSFFRFSGGGEWNLQSDLSLNDLHFYGGQMNANGHDITVRYLIYGNGDPNNVFNTGSGDIQLGYLNTNGMAVTGSSHWYFIPPYNGTFEFGRDVNLTSVTIEGGLYNFYGDNTIDNLTLDPGTTINIQDGFSLTVNSTLNAVGTRDKMISINSQSEGVQGTIFTFGASLSLDYIQVKDNIIDNGIANLVVPDNAIDNGNNTGWDFSNAITPLDFYWVGGSGNWSEFSSHWAKLSGGGGFHDSAPGPVDDVIFDQNSFPSGGTLIVDSEIEINDMIWTSGSGANNPILQADYNNRMFVHGDFILDPGVQRRISRVYFESGAGDIQNLHFGDNSGDEYSEMYFQGGGTWNLSSELVTYYVYFYDGTFNTNNNDLSVRYLYVYNDMSLSNWGNSNVTIRGQLYRSAAGATFNADNSFFVFENNASLSGPFTLNSATFTSDTYISGDNIFNDLTFEPGIVVTLQNGSNQSFANNFIATGLRDQPISIQSNSAGNAATITSLTSGTFNTEYLILQDNTVAGATFNTDNSLNNGNVTGWTFGIPLTSLNFYWVGDGGSWSDYANHWALQADGGTGFHTSAPGTVDDVYFTSNSFSTAGQTVLLDNPTSVRNMTWEANSGNNNPGISGDYDNSLTVSGSFYLDNGVNRNLRRVYFDSPNAGNTIDFADNQGDVTNTSLYFRGAGSWDMAGRVEADRIELEDATLNTNGMELDLYSVNLYNSNATINAGASAVYFNYLYDGGGLINPGTSNFIISDFGYIEVYGSSTFNEFTITSGTNVRIYTDLIVSDLVIEPGVVLQNSSGITINTSSLSAVGLGSSPITIESTSPGNTSYFSQAAGVVNAEYLIISDNEALGGATFNANNSLDGGNVVGWNIFAPVPKDYYWVGGDGLWSEASSHWVDSDGGSNFYSVAPGLADNVFFTDNSFTASGQSVNLDEGTKYINSVTWTTSPSLAPNFTGGWLKVFGSFILSDGVSGGIDRVSFEASGTSNTLDFADNQNDGLFSRMDFNGTGEWTLASDLITGGFRFDGGTLHAGNNLIELSYFDMYGSNQMTFNAEAATINTPSLYIDDYNGNITFNAGTSVLNIARVDGTAYLQTYGSSNLTFNIVNFGSDALVYGAQSFNEFNVVEGVTLQLDYNGIQTVQSLNLNGTATGIISIESTYENNEGTFSVPATGSVSADFIIFKDNHAIGGANFTATNSSQLSNVQGWTGLKEGQTINFPPLDDLIAQNTRTLNATATSGLTVDYTLLPVTGTGTISGDTFTAGTNGLVAIRGSQIGDGTFGPAKPITEFIYIGVGDEVNTLGQMKQPSYVVGAANRVSEGDSNPTPTSVTSPYEVIVSPDGKLIVAGYARVMIWNQLPDDYNVPADVVVGQADFTTNNTSPSQSTLTRARGVAVGPNGELIVADGGRGVMIWNTIPLANGTPADVVIGQTNFTSESRGLSADKFQYANSVAVAPDGRLLVCDESNHRILIFNTIPTSNGASADVVIGQVDFTSNFAGTSEQDLYYPAGLAVSENGALFIADSENNRVLMFDAVPSSNHASANRVFGQPDFTSNSWGTSATQFGYPYGVAVSRTGKLAIADYNNRVLVYNQVPADGSVPADLVLGQPSFTTNDYDYNEVDSRRMGYPSSVFWDASENFFIADRGGRRVMVYGAKDLELPTITLNSGIPSAHVLGQSTLLEFTLEDRSGIKSAVMVYEEITHQNPGEIDTWNRVFMDDQENGVYSFDILSIEGLTSNPMGFDMWIEVSDNVDNDANTYLTKARIPITYPNGFTLNTFGTGANTSDYRMFTVPLNLDNANVVSVFDGILGGTYNSGLLRVFSYPGGSSTSYNEFNEGGFTNLELGQGYFGLSASTGSENTGAGTTSFISDVFEISPGEESTFHYVPVNLVDGWNLIGNPTLFTLDWSYALQSNGLTTTEITDPQAFDDGGYELTNEIDAGKGVFVRNNTGGSLVFAVPAYNRLVNGRVASRKLNVNPLSSNSWEVRFNATSNANKEFILGGVGMEEGALESYDGNDWLNPPTFAEMKVIEFKKPKDSPFSLKKDIRPYTESGKWEFEYRVTTAELEQHTITWDNSYFGEDAPGIFLIDKTHLKVIDMREESTYTFDHKGISKFEVHFGELALEALLPDQTLVDSPYPNPFITDVNINIGLPASQEDYKVSITIYNSVGRLVKNLANVSLSAGYHNFNWDGNNDQGVRMATGMYAYKVNISGENSSQISGQLIKR